MNTFKTILLAMALGLSATAVFADAPLTKTVNYTALDVTRTEGAEQLYRWLNAASKQVCAPADGSSVAQKYRYGMCVDTALANAIAQVNQPLVTSIYETRGRSASIRLASR